MRILRALVVVGLLLPGCDDAGGGTPASEPSPVPVALETAVRRSLPRTLERTATLASRRDHPLICESAGVVVERTATEGGRLEAGAVVLRLDDAAERDEVAARRTAWQELVMGGAPVARRHEARALLSRAEEALRRRRVLAPAAATLDRYLVEPGEWVAAGTPVARFIDPSRLFCIATVLEADVLRIAPDGEALLTVAALPEVRFPARVVRVGAGGQAGTGRFEVELEVAPDPRLRPGFVVTARLPLEGSVARLTVPREAVFTRHGTDRVFTAEAAGDRLRAVERAIRTRALPGDPTRVEVLEGLDDGARIVVRGRTGLATGQLLEPRRP